MNTWTLKKLKLLHGWQLPLKERLTRRLIKMKDKNGNAFFEGIVFSKNGCLVHVDTRNYIEYKIFSEGGYEDYISNLIKHYYRCNTAFLDIGANIGIHSLSVASIKDSRVYAFEPIDFIQAKLKKNIKLNNYSNIQVIPVALSNEPKEIRTSFSVNSSNQGTFSMIDENSGENYIKCIKGDDFVSDNKIDNISVIKIDVEGFEYSVLDGLRQTILKQRPVMFFEFDSNYIDRDRKTAEEYEKLLFGQLNYSLFIIEQSLLIPCKTLQTIKGMKEILALPKDFFG